MLEITKVVPASSEDLIEFCLMQTSFFEINRDNVRLPINRFDFAVLVCSVEIKDGFFTLPANTPVLLLKEDAAHLKGVFVGCWFTKTTDLKNKFHYKEALSNKFSDHIYNGNIRPARENEIIQLVQLLQYNKQSRNMQLTLPNYTH